MSDVERGLVIVGAGLAASRLAEQLRRVDFAGPITIIGNEVHLPYDHPPLSKDVLADAGKTIDAVVLKPREFYDENRIELRLGVPATSLDPTSRTVVLEDGSTVPYGELVIATGLVPRRIPSLPDLAGVHVLRSADDCFALRTDIADARRVTVIGAGFIGCEVASTLNANGIEVTLVEPLSVPLQAALGEELGAMVARLHRDAGVDLRLGVGVDTVEGESRVEAVRLSDGTRLTADVVVLGIGSHPATGWLQGAGVAMDEADKGIVCDGHGRTNVPHVWALGDVASWAVESGGHRRVEHWSNVAEQVRMLVPALLGREAAADRSSVPYFWSDQFDVKIQSLGHPSGTDTVHVVSDDGHRFLAYLDREGALSAVVGCGMASAVMKMRAKIAAQTPIEEVLA